MLLLVLELAANAGYHPLFKGGIGLGFAVSFFEQIMHKSGLLISRAGGGIGLQTGFELSAFLGRQLAVQGGGDQIVERIVG
jgi:hypothetical protein